MILVFPAARPRGVPLAPGQAGVLADSGAARHVEEGFALAALVSTGVGVLAAFAVAAAGSLFVARRIAEPIALAARTATRLAAGDYAARVEQPGWAPNWPT